MGPVTVLPPGTTALDLSPSRIQTMPANPLATSLKRKRVAFNNMF